MTRHQRLQRTKRSPQRLGRTWRNRSGRQIRRLLRACRDELFTWTETTS